MRLITPLAVLALLAAAGCSSSSSSHALASSSTVSVKTGTETIKGQVSGTAADANSPVFPLTFAGPVNATAEWSPPGNNNATVQVTTFNTSQGDLNVTANIPASQRNVKPKYLGAPCRYAFTMHVSYVINGAKSTGAWTGAQGHGAVVVTFTAELPKLASGACNLSSSAQPVKGKSTAVFAGAGPVTVRA